MFAFIAFPPDVIARTSGISGWGNFSVGKDVKWAMANRVKTPAGKSVR